MHSGARRAGEERAGRLILDTRWRRGLHAASGPGP
jgi:hypothetical protein